MATRDVRKRDPRKILRRLAARQRLGIASDSDSDDDLYSLAVSLRARYPLDPPEDELAAPAAALAVPAAGAQAGARQGAEAPARAWEQCEARGEGFAVPVVMAEALRDPLRSVLSGGAWAALPEADRERLRAMLPPEARSDADVEGLLAGSAAFTRFGRAPVPVLGAELHTGQLAPGAQRLRRGLQALLREQHNQSLREHHQRVIERVAAFRRSVGIDAPDPRSPLASLAQQHGGAGAQEDEAETDSASSADDAAVQDGALRRPKKRLKTAGQEAHRARQPTPSFVFFNVLRNSFASVDWSLAFDELVRRVSKAEAVLQDVPQGLPLERFVRAGLKFLEAPQSAEGDGVEQAVLPFVRQDPAGSDAWHWCDRHTARAREDQLQAQEQLFWFALARSQWAPDGGAERCELRLTGLRSQKCVLTIDPTPVELVEEFRRHEVERYRAPESAYEYRLPGGPRVVVAPLKRGAVTRAGNPAVKPREHFLLKADRPAHVNILPLVRDAAARLPGGVGTRPDVALLLRDSQWVVTEGVSDAQRNTVVSGALDRLHAERDPCVRFDPDQKLWIYRHRHRTVADWPRDARPRRQQAAAPAQRQTPPPVVASQPTVPPPPVPQLQPPPLIQQMMQAQMSQPPLVRQQQPQQQQQQPQPSQQHQQQAQLVQPPQLQAAAL